jgi:hypothetical protein
MFGIRKKLPVAVVVVTNLESDRLDKWAETCQATKVREVHLLPKLEKEKTYRFQTPELKETFVTGLKANFGYSAVLVR